MIYPTLWPTPPYTFILNIHSPKPAPDAQPVTHEVYGQTAVE